jgi:hypothetical protein
MNFQNFLTTPIKISQILLENNILSKGGINLILHKTVFENF